MAKKRIAPENCTFCGSHPCQCATTDKRKVHKPTRPADDDDEMIAVPDPENEVT